MEHDLSHLEEYVDQPYEVSVETWAFCNASCTFCPYTQMDRRGERMEDWLIEKLVDEMSQWDKPFFFSPFKVNEPLLDKRTIPLCKSVIDRTLGVVRFFTNGTALTDQNIESLANLDRLAQLWVSLNEYRPQEYRDLMGLDFEKTARRLDRLHDRGFPHPVMLSTVGYPNEDFRYYCFKRWPDFESMAIRQTDWIGQVDGQEFPIPDGGCPRWWELSIMSNGVVSLCCMDSEGKYSIGDVKEQTMLDVYRAMREHRIERKRDFDPCVSCNY